MVMNKDGQCPICHRLHDLDDACPQRIANALMMLPEALGKLTKADSAWLTNHNDFFVLDEIEGVIAHKLEEEADIE